MSPREALDVLPKPVRQTFLVLGGLVGLAVAVVAAYISLEAWVGSKASAAAETAVERLANDIREVKADVREVKRDVRATRRAMAAHAANNPALLLAEPAVDIDAPAPAAKP